MSASVILSVIAPQFDSVAGRDTYLEFASLQVTEEFFGSDRVDYAIAYMAAHLLTLDTNSNVTGLSSGPVRQKREGDLSVSFESTKGEKNIDALLAETSYGRTFLMLRNSSGGFIGISNQGSWAGWPTPPGGHGGSY